MCLLLVFCFKQKTAYDMRISDWSSDVCSSDLLYFLGAIEGCGDHITRMETGKQREIVYRIATNGVIPIDEGRNLPRIAQNIPQSQILMYQATPVELK